MNPALRFHQTAFVVRDLDAAVRRWWDELGVGPWSVWTMAPSTVTEMTYHGAPASFSFRHALAWMGDVQYELVEPIEGPSVFADQLATVGEGLNHVGVAVPDQPAMVADFLARGFTLLQSGRFGAIEDGRFAYFAVPGIPAIVELIGPPSQRFAPDYVYPEG